jgi:hypothetical protein
MVFGASGTIAGIIIGNQMAANTSGSGVIFVWALDPILIGLPITLFSLIVGTFIENKIKQNKLAKLGKSLNIS